MYQNAPAILIQLHGAEQIEQLVRQFSKCACLFLVTARQSNMMLHATDVPVPNEIAGKLRQHRVQDTRYPYRFAPSVSQLSNLRKAVRIPGVLDAMLAQFA